MRLDKYLKVSRLIKRRTVANEACDNGLVTVNGKPARASYDVKVGDLLELQLGERVLKAEVLSVTEYAKKEERKVPHIIQSLFVHFRNPDHLPDYMQKIAEEEGVDTASCDYVAGMTDHYAVACYQELFIPKAWNLGLGH